MLFPTIFSYLITNRKNLSAQFFCNNTIFKNIVFVKSMNWDLYRVVVEIPLPLAVQVLAFPLPI